MAMLGTSSIAQHLRRTPAASVTSRTWGSITRPQVARKYTSISWSSEACQVSRERRRISHSHNHRSVLQLDSRTWDHSTTSRPRSASTTATSQTINLSKHPLPNATGTLATITICNPSKLNIVSRATLHELQQALETVTTDEDIRVVIFTGQSDPTNAKAPAFCAGANIKEMESISTPQEAMDFISIVHKTCDAIMDLKAITIARIDGLCFGAGLELAACCDFRYGTKRSNFSMKEVAVGIPSVVHARLLANTVGWQAAKRMVLLGKEMDASEAGQLGLLDVVCDHAEELDAKVDEDVRLIAGYGRKAVRVQKELNAVWEREGLREGIDAGIEAFGRMWEDGGQEPNRYMRTWMERSRSK